ncbi:hypothetical protein J6X04_01115 [Candidatus Saccharibacteria bacterium]|nr:hypothetical protein [Candidatus Saccharibacteria bacterium]
MGIKINATTFNIIGGPNRDNLFDAMKYAYEIKIPIKFDIVAGYTAPVGNPDRHALLLDVKNIQIHTIQHEDGSGYSFNIYGYIDVKEPNGYYSPYNFYIYYSARSRKGSIRLSKEPLTR